MAIAGDNKLHIYVVNVGQGDTTIIVSPKGNVTLIDAYRPTKILNLLNQLGNDGNIEHLILSHPHNDHFAGGNRIAEQKRILNATFSPYWHSGGMGPPTYKKLVERLVNSGTNCSFLSGYNRFFPDDFKLVDNNNELQIDPKAIYLELLGPTNAMIKNTEAARTYNVNHLSIMTRIAFNNFRMIVAADAQLENWQAFDSERLMEDNCQILRTAHHGSSNGTQWERIDRIDPSYVIVSSDPQSGHHLPDLASAGIFAKYDLQNTNSRSAIVTADSGTIYIKSTGSNRPTLKCYKEGVKANVDMNQISSLTHSSNYTDWLGLVMHRIDGLSL